MSRRFTSIFLVLATLAPFSVNATLMGTGDGLLDTDTGLEWLNTDLNEGIGYDTMIATGLNGYLAEGYRYATVAEIGVLWGNAGALVPAYGGVTNDSANATAGLLLTSLLGNQYDVAPGERTFIQAFSADIVGNTVLTPWIDTTGTASLGGYLPSTSTASVYISSWLVRTGQVPEPGTLGLFGVALFGLGFLKRRKA